MYHYPTPPPSGRTASEEILLLAEVGIPVDPDTLWRAGYEEVEIGEWLSRRRRSRKAPRPQRNGNGRRWMVLLDGQMEPFPPTQGHVHVSDAIASEPAPAKRNGHAAAHTPAAHDHPHRAAAHTPTEATAMVSGRTQPWRIRRRKR